MVPRRDAARHLQVNDPGLDTIATDNLAHDDLQRRIAHWRIDTQLG